MEKEISLVGKIGSMALIRRGDSDIDYNIFSRIGAELRPGMVWVASGAVEIGRIDYIKRAGRELSGDADEIKTDYSAQGQAILMENYRRFVRPEYSVRQFLVEHTHFNSRLTREYIRQALLRCAAQGAVPIVNYNDTVSFEEHRKMELMQLRDKTQDVVECVDNDETAAVIAQLVGAKTLLILTSADGIYADPKDPKTLVREVTAADGEEMERKIRELQAHCVGASRAGANGAKAKLEYILPCARAGMTVVIGNARWRISELLSGAAPSTRFMLK